MLFWINYIHYYILKYFIIFYNIISNYFIVATYGKIIKIFI